MEPPASPGNLLQPLSRQKCPSLKYLIVCESVQDALTGAERPCGLYFAHASSPPLGTGYVNHLCRKGCRRTRGADFHHYVVWERETEECAVPIIIHLMTSGLLTLTHKYSPDLPNMALTTDPVLMLDFKHCFRFSLHTHTAS